MADMRDVLGESDWAPRPRPWWGPAEPAPALEDPEPAPEPEPAREELPPPAPPQPRQSVLRREVRLPRRAPRERRGARRLVGLKLGASQIAAATVQNDGGPRLLQLARSPLERGIVVGGDLRDPDALAAELKGFFRSNKLPRKNVRLGIASNRIGVRTLELPLVADPKLLDNAVRFHAQEALPFPLAEAVLDYVPLDGFVDEAGEPRQRVLLVFAHRELVDRYVAACRRAGLKLAGIDLEAFALLRSLSQPREEAGGAAVVAVAVGQERTVFAVSDGRTCDFTRVLEWGGYSLDVVVGRVLDLTPSQAEPVKRRLSLLDAAVPDGVSAEQAAAAREAMRGELAVLARELVSSLHVYQERPGSLDIGEILVTGGGAQLPGVVEELERLVGVPVRHGDPLARVAVSKKLKPTPERELGSLAVAIGLGIED